MALKELCRWCWEARRAHGLPQEGLGAVNKHICPSILELGKALVALSYKMGPVHTDGEDSRAGLSPQQNQRLNWLRHRQHSNRHQVKGTLEGQQGRQRQETPRKLQLCTPSTFTHSLLTSPSSSQYLLHSSVVVTFHP